MYPLTATAKDLIPRLVRKPDRARMLAAFEKEARKSRSPQIGAKHVLKVVLETGYYEQLGKDLAGGPGSGMSDPPRDVEADWQRMLDAD